MPMQIELWPVYNLAIVLVSFTILHLTTEIPFKMLALYSLRYGTLKRVTRMPRVLYAGCAKNLMYLKHFIYHCGIYHLSLDKLYQLFRGSTGS